VKRCNGRGFIQNWVKACYMFRKLKRRKHKPLYRLHGRIKSYFFWKRKMANTHDTNTSCCSQKTDYCQKKERKLIALWSINISLAVLPRHVLSVLRRRTLIFRFPVRRKIERLIRTAHPSVRPSVRLVISATISYVDFQEVRHKILYKIGHAKLIFVKMG
jgi:hypothetical protein